jgi:DNA-binding MarR family transcriptional regulator
MEAMGLIERRRSESDRRVSHVHLTARGRRLEQRLVPIAVAVINEAVAGLPREELDRMKRALDRMRANLEGA